MIPFIQLVITAMEAVGEICGRKKPTTPAELERQRIQRRNGRAMMFFAIFCVIFILIVLCLMIFK